MESRYIALVAGILLVLAVGVIPSPVHSADQLPSLPSSLSLTIVPAKLPADGGTYSALVISLLDKSGSPTLAINDTKVYLSSSGVNVGQVANSSLLIRAGKNFVVAGFTTTLTPGSTQITGSSSGLQSGTVSVVTAVPIGYPTHLTLTAVPDTISPTATRQGILILGLLDDAGLPAKAVARVDISLFSSNTQVLTLNESTVSILAGKFLRPSAYVTSFVPGSALVTATSSQFQSSSVLVNVLGQPPLALKLYAQPDRMVTCLATFVVSPLGCQGRLVIALTDLAGSPARAPSDTIVQIRSSNTTVVTAPLAATIRAGRISTVATYTTTPARGTAKITVSAPGLSSDFGTIVTSRPSAGKPVFLKLFVGPNPVLADSRSYSSVVVSLINGSGLPFANLNSSPVNITLTSSQLPVGSFNSLSLMVNPGYNFNGANFTSTFVVGTTLLTASAQNLLPDVSRLSTFGPIPSKVLIKAIAPILPADGGSQPAIQLILQDAFGSPASAPQPNGISVTVSSSQDGIAKIMNGTTILPGRVSSIVYIKTSAIAGLANLTAFLSTPVVNPSPTGYSKSATVVQTIVPAPSRIAAVVTPQISVLSRSGNQPNLVVQLQDNNGNPARSRQQTIVTITSTNPSVLRSPLTASIPLGANYVSIPVLPLSSGSTTLTLLAAGLASANVPMTVVPSPISLTIVSSPITIQTTQTAILTATLTIDGVGMKGVGVTWLAKVGGLSLHNGTTNSQGQAFTTFKPSGAGVANIVATMSTLSTGPINASAVIVVSAPVPRNPSPAEQLVGFPYVLGLVGGVAAAVLLVFLFVRRRRGKPGEAPEFGEASGLEVSILLP